MYSEPRACRPEELPGLIDLANRVFSPDLSFPMGENFPLLFCAENAEHLRVIDRDGEIVSHVGVLIRDAVLLGVPVRVAAVGAVCTDSGCRGAGLASRLMEDARAHSIAHGVDLMLISGGRGLYHRLGYVQVGRFPSYRVTNNDPRRQEELRVTLYEPADLPAVMALHEREPIRFRRSAADWKGVLQAGHLSCRGATLWVVRLGDRPVAYVAVARPQRKRDGSLSAACAWEYAGDRWAIAETLPAVRDRMQAPAIEIMGPDGDLALAGQAAVRGWSLEWGSFHGTLGILRPDRFLGALSPWIAERLGASGAGRLRIAATESGARFTIDEESYAVETPGQLTALVFGGETEEARAIPPLAGRVGETLRRLFPMPLFAYGYNFV
jgi:ribosomal protein S18 acetylase RimI-like enzyme